MSIAITLDYAIQDQIGQGSAFEIFRRGATAYLCRRPSRSDSATAQGITQLLVDGGADRESVLGKTAWAAGALFDFSDTVERGVPIARFQAYGGLPKVPASFRMPAAGVVTDNRCPHYTRSLGTNLVRSFEELYK